MGKFAVICAMTVIMTLCLRASPAHAFGVDVCYNSPDAGIDLIRNCIGVEEHCRTSNLEPSLQVACRVAATADSLSGLTGGNEIIGGRSLLHSDTTYLIAQLIGYTPWQAYQVMIYNEATDQSDYFPFDQEGRQMLDDEQIAACRRNWGAAMPRHCWVITPLLNGLYKFNDEAGGMLLHLHARFSPNGAPPPPIDFPTDYLSPENAPYELLITNLRDWAFDRRADACVSGIVARTQGADRATARCEVRDRVIKSPQSFFALGVSQLQIPFSSQLGTLVANKDERGTVLASDRSLQKYITPHQVNYAKLGVFLHALADRASHHVCTDRSWFWREASGDYNSTYDKVACAQGSHFLWHAWEQGTNQDPGNLAERHQTIRWAVESYYDQLLENAQLRGLPLRAALNRQDTIDRLVGVLGIFDSRERLDAMVALMEFYGTLPLPGHGAVAGLNLEQWLQAAGAPQR
jgi:hypothetical protein